MQGFLKDSCRYHLLFYVGGFSTVAYPKQYLNTDWKVQFSDMYNPTTKSSANLLSFKLGQHRHTVGITQAPGISIVADPDQLQMTKSVIFKCRKQLNVTKSFEF